eukprot:TRINITY_DN8656_c0_g1_i8.p1 TRINITY_DN8656_c0_g1~~TRINITY_DN8656_c0_g1_i8.p1  ORF type:complete len:292 (-),score=65.03 TRINITY_DN8656_c0_g1_i8:35-910(-)
MANQTTYSEPGKGDTQSVVAVNDDFVLELKNRLDKLEDLVNEYIKSFIDPEAMAKAQRIMKNYVSVEEKFDSMLFLLKNYKLISEKIIRPSLMHLREMIKTSRNQARLEKAKETSFEEIMKVLKVPCDVMSPNFNFVLEFFYMLLTNDTVVKKAYEDNAFQYIFVYLKKLNTIEENKCSLLKITSYFCRFEEFLSYINEKKLMPSLSTFVIVHIELFIDINKELKMKKQLSRDMTIDDSQIPTPERTGGKAGNTPDRPRTMSANTRKRQMNIENIRYLCLLYTSPSPRDQA